MGLHQKAYLRTCLKLEKSPAEILPTLKMGKYISFTQKEKEQEDIENNGNRVELATKAPTTAKRSFSYTTAATEEFSTESKIMRVCR